MGSDAIQRRAFLGSACGALGLAALAGDAAGASADDAPAGGKVPPELQAVRDKLMADMEANRGIGVPRCDGQFLNLIVHVTAAKNVLEVGTYRGYSGIWLALGLEHTGGRLTTIDIDPARVREARGNFTTAGLADRITGLEGDAHKVAKTLAGPFDLVFLDADKGNEVDYFHAVFPKLRPGGFILLHNAITSRKVMTPYLDLVSQHPEIVHVVLSLSMTDGFSVSFHKRPAGDARSERSAASPVPSPSGRGLG
ncbi:MAG: O-methyltransferase [Thermoguttaceae bacterium]|jgi:predicted O-methyltransferase YrrM